MRKQTLVVGLFACTTLLAATGADWPRFRGPNGTGIADDKNLPVKWTDKNILFKTEIPGRGHSSPIVSKGRIFLESSSEDGKERYLLCLDAKSGTILWSKSVPGDKGHTHDKNTLASSTPAADGERIYVVFWDGESLLMSAYDYAGQGKWQQPLGKFKSQHGAGISPVVAGDVVVVNVDQDGKAELRGFDSKSGKPVWSKKRSFERACYSSPFLREKADGGIELVVASTGGITGYNPKDGEENWNYVWKFDRMRLRTVASPIYHEGTIFAVSGDGGGDRDMIAVKPGDAGHAPSLVWEKKKQTPYVPTPVAKDGFIFWVTDKERRAFCVDAKTGNVIWDERLDRSAEMTASLVMVDGKIYAVDESGTVFVFAAAPEFKLLARNEVHEPVSATPAVADGRMYIRGAKHLFCIAQ